MIILLELSEMDFIRKLSFLVFQLCVLISLKKENAETKNGSPTITWSSSSDSASILSYPSMSLPVFISSTEAKKFKDVYESLEYDFYRESCPRFQKIIRSSIHCLNMARSDVAPALLRLVFHDCFIEVKFLLLPSSFLILIPSYQGCDESVLLDAIDGVDSEKESPPNETLKGFDLIDIIKSKLEEACPGVVSCADILFLAARESGGGPFYPLKTGRRDSNLSFSEIATYELPSPQDDLPQTITSFASRGFDERETASLLGAHSIGTIRCKFILNRLYNFCWTDEPDPTIDIEVVNLLRSRCNNGHTSQSSSPSASPYFVNGSPSASPFLLMAQYLPHLRRQEWRWAMHHGDLVLACCTTVVF
ncbi:putative Peroxidase 48 [Camellia lanceoleosa]|uniref:Peroxidase 48 n=1 Tax=Camellia lanceoleosa TaxID=1840588 RepID=A0ACC0I491_9ERIC|nr:putative Peroxidase 48 [Camellia lanceoleosa]